MGGAKISTAKSFLAPQQLNYSILSYIILANLWRIWFDTLVMGFGELEFISRIDESELLRWPTAMGQPLLGTGSPMIAKPNQLVSAPLVKLPNITD